MGSLTPQKLKCRRIPSGDISLEEREREKGIYILSSHAGPMQDARRLKPKRPKPSNCKQEN